jgi:integrase
MIYKRGCNKKGPNGTCSKCGERGACGVYWYKFMWQGKLMRESTKQGNDKIARQMESAHRTSLAKGEVGIREKKAAPTLAEFLKKDFLPYAETSHAAKPNTLRYYKTGTASLLDANLGKLSVDEINDQHAKQYAAKLSNLSPSTVNCGLRTLRRAINLAVEWGTIDRKPKISLAKGERQRDRVLNEREQAIYLAACNQPWKDAATIMLGTAMRPGEVFALRWERIVFNDQDGGLIQIADGKSKAARRYLPMVRTVYSALRTRWEAAGRPESGWVFPSQSKCGHITTPKTAHATAIATANKEKKQLEYFEPYCLRHTAGTMLGDSGCDVFTLARIMGHSSILITQRYIHPQAESIERAFSKFGVGTKLGKGVGSGHKTGHNQKTRVLLTARKSRKLLQQ